jgi:hypothetical protein
MKVYTKERPLRVLNLGAGVQSTAVALMIHKGELPQIDCAVFADVGEEPEAVMRHLAWLIEEVKGSFPVHVVSNGRLGDGLSVGRTRAKGHTTIPAFTLGRKGELGKTSRQCTGDYKIDPIERYIRRELLGIKPRGRVPKGTAVVQVFGLSFEEMGRAHRVRMSFHKTGHSKFATPEFPLIDREMKRGHCIRWLRAYGVPHEVERSACVFCPYKSDGEWQRLKMHDASGWKRALEVDELLRTASSKSAYGMRNAIFLHRSCRPLGEIDFRTPEQTGAQPEMPFVGECTGMCGL